jgi:peptide/nickel transport system permease protein
MVFIDAVPMFWTGMLLIAVFSVSLGWFPSYGAIALNPGRGWFDAATELARRLVLPVITLSLGSAGHTFLVARASMHTALGGDYVRAAAAKGLARRTVLFRHALRNAVLPIYTHTALAVGSLLSGAVVVETVFSYPGVGRLIAEAVAARDFPLLQGAFLAVVVGIIGANLLTDLTYPLLDPRLRRSSA